MSDQPSSEKQVSSPKFLHPPWAVFVACGVVVALGICVAQVVGGWLGGVIWLVAWGVMVVLACIVTYKDTNFARWAIGWAAMTGVLSPRPSDVWVRQIVGEGWGMTIDIGISAVVTVIAALIFGAIAMRHKSSSAG
jgi:hypothetical protein